MPRFFIDSVGEEYLKITGSDAQHIVKSLRMKQGEDIVLCDKQGYDYRCKITDIKEEITCKIIDKVKCVSEPSVNVTLYQAIPKGDKFETIIQKCVELGITRIVPVITSRCISRPDSKSFSKKLERYNKISLEAAKQSGRGIIPKVCNIVSFDEAINSMKNEKMSIIFYEGGGCFLSDLDFNLINNVSFMVGSEGGFSTDEVIAAENCNIIKAGLGPRILRCETAPVAALAIIHSMTKNM